jgi:hypothetical protein
LKKKFSFFFFKGAEDGGAVSADKIDVSRKPAVSGTPNSKKSKKKKKNSNDLTPPQINNPMIAITSGISPRGIDTYNLPPTMLNQHMSLPIIKSEQNDNDPKVYSNFILTFFSII